MPLAFDDSCCSTRRRRASVARSWHRQAVFIIFHLVTFARGKCQWGPNLWLCPIEPVSCNFIACAARRGRVSSLFFWDSPAPRSPRTNCCFSLQYGSSKWRGVQRRSALGAQRSAACATWSMSVSLCPVCMPLSLACQWMSPIPGVWTCAVGGTRGCEL